MPTVVAIFFLALVAVQFVGTLVYLVLIGTLLASLKRDHANVWESLGRPSLFLNNTIRNNVLVLKWLWRKGYSDLQNPATRRHASTVRTLLLMLFMNFALLAVCALGSLVSSAVVANHAA
jgi:hypothetical protein